ncbi:MAG: methyltransferase domain-containing protein [Nitrospirae bacterium]|nr:MAG: methyltransferase domain-containing protein [Nitrospirota bacterium]
MDTPRSKRQLNCRICGSGNLRVYLDLGSTPLANSYLRKGDLSAEEFREELALQICLDCGLSQLTTVVNPDLMFKQYLYVSSTTETFRNHCVDLAGSAAVVAGCRPGDWVLDIASNDGCLLSKFRDLGMQVVGVDPAENLAAEASKAGIPTLCTYWSHETAEAVVAGYGRPQVITATNVFAHADDVHGFVQAVDRCLSPKGLFVIECPYVLDFIEKNEFDTAYHEHLSYIGIHPMQVLMGKHGMRIFKVEYFEGIHGGTIRVFVGREGEYPFDASVERFLRKEQEFGIREFRRYEAFGERILANKQRLLKLMGRLHAEGKTIWAYGASAKGNTLMNFFGMTSQLVPVVLDDNPKKWDWYTPGAHMRITGIQELVSAKVDYLLLLAWNFEPEIRGRCQAVGYAGRFILPIPDVRILESANAPKEMRGGA